MQKKTARPDSQLLRWEEELMGLIKAKVLAETETSMWAQTNMSIEEVSQLLQNSGTATPG